MGTLAVRPPTTAEATVAVTAVFAGCSTRMQAVAVALVVAEAAAAVAAVAASAPVPSVCVVAVVQGGAWTTPLRLLYLEEAAKRGRRLPQPLPASPVTAAGWGDRVTMNCSYCDPMRCRSMASRMLLTVHDELVFEAPAEEEKTLESLVRGHMERAMDLAVPLVVDHGWGSSWGEAH